MDVDFSIDQWDHLRIGRNGIEDNLRPMRFETHKHVDAYLTFDFTSWTASVNACYK